MSIELIKFENAIEEFRKLNPDFQTQAIMTFLWIARGHEQAKHLEDSAEKYEQYTTVSEIANKMRLSDASASRNVSNLSDRKNRYGNDGYGLVHIEPNPYNARYSFIELTPKGEDMARRLEAILGGKVEMVDLKSQRSSVTNSRRGIDPKTGWSAGVKETIKEKMDQALKDQDIEGASKATNKMIREQIGRFKASGASWSEIQDLIENFLKADGATQKQIATVRNPQAEKHYRETIEADGNFLGIKPTKSFLSKLVGEKKRNRE